MQKDKEPNHFPVDNIIVGLLKNMLRKNIGYRREGFKVFDKYFFKVDLDTLGFDESLILKSLEELHSKFKPFHKDGTYFSRDISNIVYNHDDEIISFNIEKRENDLITRFTSKV